MYEIYENAILLAVQNKYDQLENILDNQDTNKSQIHDLIAMIGVKSKDEKLLDITNHHSRLLLKEFASTDHFPFLIKYYKKNGYFEYREIDDYIWEAASFKNAKFLSNFLGYKPDNFVLEEKDKQWKTYFGYKNDEDD